MVFLYFKLRVFRSGAEIELNCRCIPRPIWEARKEKVENTNKGTKGFSNDICNKDNVKMK